LTNRIIIIGGGPAGLMASVAAAQAGAHVLLLDKGGKLGRKLGISGGGRCNVTNAKPLDELIRHIPGNGRFLYSALTAFGNQQIIEFFEGLGIALKEEDRGRMFPVSDKAKTVVDALLGEVRRLGVEVRLHSPVEKLTFAADRVSGVLLHRPDESAAYPLEFLPAAAVVVAVGGCSVPQTGSTGDGYPWARAAGHTITELYPTEVPITLTDHFIHARTLQGFSLRAIELTVWGANGKKIKTHEGDLIFTHFGLSGPAALRCSQYVVRARQSFAIEEILLTLDLLPELDLETIRQLLVDTAKQDDKKAIKTIVRNVLQSHNIGERFVPLLLESANVDASLTYPQVSQRHWMMLSESLKKFPLHANGTLSLQEAFITGGGVSVKEIDPRTMASKTIRGLYFCGEVLDVHGYTGGYNITAAFSSGHCAGRAAAAHLQSPP
jgi:predicted Rossmann fold flavoprotein